MVRVSPAPDSPEDFVADLRRLRAHAGDLSFRNLNRIAQKRIADELGEARLDPLSPSTTSEVLSGKRLPRLPRLEFVESYVAVCLSASGLDEPGIAAGVARWRERWRLLSAPGKPDEPVESVRTPAPRRPALLPLAVVFLVGLAIGVAGTLGWTGRRLPRADAAAGQPSAGQPSAGAPDVCVSPETALPAGQDVLRLPPAGRKTGSWWVNDTRMAALSTDGRRFEAAVTAGTSRPGDILVVKGDVELVKGRTYVLAFTAAADLATTVRVRVQDSEPQVWQASDDREVLVDQDPCRHLYRFVAQKSSTHSELTFQVGGRAHSFHLRVLDAALVETAG
ncbi:hypothetical protein [Actinoplanes sp. NPDC051494]|uniref:hypothetical protein n=1 Tax=Actinoplanes sp. NPDC051494 TaxID=3363907 RepID=UPI0037AC73C8